MIKLSLEKQVNCIAEGQLQPLVLLLLDVLLKLNLTSLVLTFGESVQKM